jgi:hypothetical protein
VLKEVRDGEMPEGEIGLRKEIDPKLREAILKTGGTSSRLSWRESARAWCPDHTPGVSHGLTILTPDRTKSSTFRVATPS